MSEQYDPNLIRTYVDGELDGAEAAELEKGLESDRRLQAQVRFEHLLRKRVGSVMRESAGAAPEGLADHIRAALAKAPTESEPDREIVVGRVDHAGATLRRGDRRSWSGPTTTNPLALAAALVLVAGVVLIGIFGRQISPGGGDLAVQTARFVEGVHIKCAESPEVLAKVTPWHVPAEAERQLMLLLDSGQVTVFDLGSLGYQFIGAGECHVPGSTVSGHFFHERPATEERPQAMVSLYVVPDQGQYEGLIEDLRPGEWFELPAEAGSDDRIHGITNGSIIYFLVCPCHHDRGRLQDEIARHLAEEVQ